MCFFETASVRVNMPFYTNCKCPGKYAILYNHIVGYSGASFLYKSYMGEVSVNAMWDWLGEHTDLQALVKKAFR
ncbi:hypothetical protein DPMN_087905 [Dreissena polymorpha]|uniref:Uncharacterized protein n=1 Tax=Dreissena polymorpha TaxID=45954 RepID=A0A9D4QWM0_DREPO|nr:hypothetical protein DPMN_087905 [Dreissena polymorpha]